MKKLIVVYKGESYFVITEKIKKALQNMDVKEYPPKDINIIIEVVEEVE